MRFRVLCAVLLAATHIACAQSGDNWKKLQFLMGKWTGAAGEKDTPNGAGQGDFSFDAELNKQIVVRHNNSNFDSGAQHDDLMVIYLDNAIPRAIYFDSEGHVIRYNLTFPSANRVVFESDGTQPGPRYRLSYGLEGAVLKGRFEVGSSAADYKSYLDWSAKRK